MAAIQWTPYAAKIKEQLNDFDLTFKTVWKNGESFCEIGTNEKIAGAGLVYVAHEDTLRFGMCTVFPAAEFDLPIYFSRWEEHTDSIIFLVDLIPTVDTLVDEPYRKKYIEPLDPLWQRYESLPGICPEEHDRLRSVLSIIYTAAHMPIEREGMRIASLSPHLEYLKKYREFFAEAMQITDEKKLKEIWRRTAAVKQMLRQFISDTTRSFGISADKCLHIIS